MPHTFAAMPPSFDQQPFSYKPQQTRRSHREERSLLAHQTISVINHPFIFALKEVIRTYYFHIFQVNIWLCVDLLLLLLRHLGLKPWTDGWIFLQLLPYGSLLDLSDLLLLIRIHLLHLLLLIGILRSDLSRIL